MNVINKEKLKHDFLNSIVIINSMSKSASNFLTNFSKNLDENDNNKKQIKRFLHSMDTIREQTKKIEDYFQNILNK